MFADFRISNFLKNAWPPWLWRRQQIRDHTVKDHHPSVQGKTRSRQSNLTKDRLDPEPGRTPPCIRLVRLSQNTQNNVTLSSRQQEIRKFLLRSGEHRPPACWFRLPAETDFLQDIGDGITDYHRWFENNSVFRVVSDLSNSIRGYVFLITYFRFVAGG